MCIYRALKFARMSNDRLLKAVHEEKEAVFDFVAKFFNRERVHFQDKIVQMMI